MGFQFPFFYNVTRWDIWNSRMCASGLKIYIYRQSYSVLGNEIKKKNTKDRERIQSADEQFHVKKLPYALF